MTASLRPRAAVSRRDVEVGSPVAAAPHPQEQERADGALVVRGRMRPVTGEAGRALAAAQGRALSALLASLGDVEVGQGKEVSP